MKNHPDIDAYIANLPGWQQAVCTQIRQWIHEAEPNIDERIKFTDRPYFVHNGNVAALLAAKNHINVFIYDPIAADPKHLINQGKDNSTARAIQLYEGQTIDGAAFVQLIRAVVANNNAGGWRKLSGTRSTS